MLKPCPKEKKNKLMKDWSNVAKGVTTSAVSLILVKVLLFAKVCQFSSFLLIFSQYNELLNNMQKGLYKKKPYTS